MDCGNTFHPAAMQWDHLNPESKFRGLAQMSQYKFERCLSEIAKCELVCANCHAVRTYNRTQHTLITAGFCVTSPRTEDQ